MLNVFVRFTADMAPAGNHRFVIRLNANGRKICDYTVDIKVWNFAYPEERTVETSMGLSYDGLARLYGFIDKSQKVASPYCPEWVKHKVVPTEAVPYVDEKGLNHRIQFWQQYNINADGFLYWSSNYWGSVSNPWASMVTVPNLRPDVFGDGSLLYSGIGKDENGEAIVVLPSVRLDNIRDGIEDAELLKMAEKIFGREAVLELVKPVAKDMVNYTSGSATLQQQRIAIAEALMAATKQHKKSRRALRDFLFI